MPNELPYEPVQTFWVGPEIPAAQAACLASFLLKGHSVHLYCYEEPSGVPNGVAIQDARKIMKESDVFAYGPAAGVHSGSLAACSNIFRYRLLHERGGYWIDTDVFCLKPLPQQDIVISKEVNRQGQPTAASCVLRSPAGHPFSKYCLDVALSRNRNDLKFGEIGPVLVQRAVDELNLAERVSQIWEFCPINFTEFERLAHPGELPLNACTVHLWNESWRRRGSTIPWPGPPNSILWTLSQRLNTATVHDWRTYA